MPRIKKSTVTDTAEIQPTPQQAEFSITTPVSTSDNKDLLNHKKPTAKAAMNIRLDIQTPLPKIPKEKFKQLHIKDTYWLENDIYQTIADITEGKKGAKALIINQALKDYLKKNKLKIKPLKVKGKKDL